MGCRPDPAVELARRRALAVLSFPEPMQMKKLFGHAPGRSGTETMNAVVVCVDRAHSGEAAIGEEDVEDLAARLGALVMARQLGDYDGCDSFSSESRLYFFSREADRLAAAAMEVIAMLPWCERVRVRVSLDPLGVKWRYVAT